MQIGPFDPQKGILGFVHPEGIRMDIDVQRAVEVARQVESARLEDRPLPIQSSVRVIRRRCGRNPIALSENAFDKSPFLHIMIVLDAAVFEPRRHRVMGFSLIFFSLARVSVVRRLRLLQEMLIDKIRDLPVGRSP